jgi:uncharacterized spore protein YtfJ
VDADQLLTTVRDALTVRRVFGEPVVQDGVTLVPCALVMGGMGGGEGHGGDGETGSGGGFGVIALPAGVFRIADGRVKWHPAISANLLIVASTVLSLALVRARSRTARARLAAGSADRGH